MHVYVIAICITLGIQLSGFAAAFAFQTEKFYDILGAVNYFALAVWSLYFASDGHGDFRQRASTAVFLVSRGWLLAFLAWRAHERGGDARFDEVKSKFFEFLLFWIVQGVWVMMISMPMLFVNSSTVQSHVLTPYDWLLLAGFSFGVLIEVVADVQKAIWVKAGRPGDFCQTGVWSLSRHPNYFGEICQWWCHWAFAFSSARGLADPMWWACAASPMCTMHILFNVPETGIAQSEGEGLKRYYDKCPEEYAKYRQNTSILFPMAGYRYVPLFLKRTVFLDFRRFEYRPQKSAYLPVA